MLKDITLGQFFPGDTIAHRLDPRTKLILVVLYIISLFQAVGWGALEPGVIPWYTVTGKPVASRTIRPRSDAYRKQLPPHWLIRLAAISSTQLSFHTQLLLVCS